MWTQGFIHSISFASRIDANLVRSHRFLRSLIIPRILLPSSVSANPATSVAVITSPVAIIEDINFNTSISVADRS